MLMRERVVERVYMCMSGIVTFVLRLMLRLAGLVPAERHGSGHQPLRRQGKDDQNQHEFLQKAIHSEHSIGDDAIAQLQTASFAVLSYFVFKLTNPPERRASAGSRVTSSRSTGSPHRWWPEPVLAG